LAPRSLSALSAADVPEEARLSIGTLDKKGVHHIEWDGELSIDRGKVLAHGRYLNIRKYWYSPIGLYHYMDLVRRAIELRARTRGDISLDGFDDDGAYIHLDYTFAVPDGRTIGPRQKAVADEIAAIGSPMGIAAWLHAGLVKTLLEAPIY
jgi:hypothetical protein